MTLKRSSSISYLVNYVLRPDARYVDDKGKQLVYSHNLLGSEPEKWIQQFQTNVKSLPPSAKHRVRMHHFICSFHKENSHDLTTHILKRTARKLMGLHNGHKAQYLAVAHGNEDHIHYHLIASGLEYARNKAISLPKARFSEIQQELQFFIAKEYPELKQSLINYGHKERSLNQVKHSEYELKKEKRSSKKEVLRQQMEVLYHKSNSLNDFISKLQSQNITPYYRGTDNRLTGVHDPTSNRKYRFSTLLFSQEHLNNLDKKVNREVALSSFKREDQQPQYQDILDEFEQIRQEAEAIEQEQDIEYDDIDW